MHNYHATLLLVRELLASLVQDRQYTIKVTAPPTYLTLLLSFVAVQDVKIRVPGKLGLKVFLMYSGIPADTAGCMVLG